MNFKGFEDIWNEFVFRVVMFEIAVTIIGVGLTCWLSYLVIKAAIRDGIKESGLVGESWEETVRKAARKEPEM